MNHPVYHPVHERDASYFVRDIKEGSAWASPKFLNWLEKHMHIWDAFCAVAHEAKAKGYTKFSARAAVHIMRFKLFDELKGEAVCSNNMTPYLGRLYNHMYARDGEGDFITTRPLAK
jgi:hypothetical protein